MICVLIDKSPAFPVLPVAFALGISACSADGAADEDVICNRVTAYRVEASGCSTRAETGLRSRLRQEPRGP
jgi:hypothetical protein